MMLALALAIQSTTTPLAGVPAPPPPPVPRLAPAPPHGGAALKAMGLSDAGLRIVQTIGAPDPDSKAFADRHAALRARVGMLADAQPFDAAALVAAMKDQSAADTEARSRGLDRIVRTLQALPPADRQIYARAVIGHRDPLPPPPPAAAPVPAAAPTPPQK